MKALLNLEQRQPQSVTGVPYDIRTEASKVLSWSIDWSNVFLAIGTPMSGDGVVTNDLVPWSQVNVFLVLFHFVDNVPNPVFAGRTDGQVKDYSVSHLGFGRNRAVVRRMAGLGSRISEWRSGSHSKISSNGSFGTVSLCFEELTGQLLALGFLVDEFCFKVNDVLVFLA
jgi:hypothetical protein